MDYEEYNALSQEEQAAVLEAGGSVPAPVGAGPSSEPLSPGTSPVVSAVATARGATTTFDGWPTGDDGTHTLPEGMTPTQFTCDAALAAAAEAKASAPQLPPVVKAGGSPPAKAAPDYSRARLTELVAAKA